MKKIYTLFLIAIVFCSHKSLAQTSQCNVLVDFLSVANPLSNREITFTNLTTGMENTDSIAWYFGDGSASYELNPSHTYTEGGIYNVCLRITKNNVNQSPCTTQYCRDIRIESTCNITPDFVIYPDTQDSITNVFLFYNYTAPFHNIDSFFWDFGDGSPIVFSRNVTSHNYASAGTYTVCLKVKQVDPGTTNVLCERQVCKTVEVLNSIPCNLQANFNYTIDASNLQQVHFTNLSTGLNPTDSITWFFSDGTYSTDTNPSHTYHFGDNYTACIRIRKNDGNPVSQPCISSYCLPITGLIDYCSFTPVFYAMNDSLTNINGFTFISFGANNYNDTKVWDFGDGSPVVSQTNDTIMHVYSDTGYYLVCLIVKKILPSSTTVVCERQVCKTIWVQDLTPCNMRVGFTSQADITDAKSINFQNISAGYFSYGDSNFTWDFGDGTTGHGLNAHHLYGVPGTYNACLTINETTNCIRTFCDSVTVTAVSFCDSSIANFTYNRDYYLPNKLYFYGNSNTPLFWQQWDFIKINSADSGSYLFQNNPVYNFSDTGLYNVCMTAYFQNGCRKQSCDTISIYSIAQPETCYLLAFPNPATNTVSANIELEQAGTITSSIYSFQGILLSQSSQAGLTGNNTITLNIATLPTGFYSVRINYGNKICYARFQKL